ncbi:MAG: hypothetical protein RI883_2015 [Bacteroidota bacterium]|jgi:hypothetical protein
MLIVKNTRYSYPIAHDKRIQFDSICKSFINQTPYDYAFFGYRCGSSTYELFV